MIDESIISSDSGSGVASGASSCNDATLLEHLDRCASLIDDLAAKLVVSSSSSSSQSLIDELNAHTEKTLVKQYLDSIELLANIYGFLGHAERRVATFERLVKIVGTLLRASDLSSTTQQQQQSKSTTTSASASSSGPIRLDLAYTNACVNLTKALVDIHRCDRFEAFVAEMLGISGRVVDHQQSSMGADLTNKPSSANGKKSSSTRSTKSSAAKESSGKINNATTSTFVDRVLAAFETDKYLQPKSNVTFYLILTHYLILKHRVLILTCS